MGQRIRSVKTSLPTGALELEPPRWLILSVPVQSSPGLPAPQVHASTCQTLQRHNQRVGRQSEVAALPNAYVVDHKEGISAQLRGCWGRKTLVSRLAAERSNCWPLVSTISTGIVGVKPIAVSLSQHAVPACRKPCLSLHRSDPLAVEQAAQEACSLCGYSGRQSEKVTDPVRQGSQVWTSWVHPQLRRPVQLQPQQQPPVLRLRQWLAAHCRPQMQRHFRRLARLQSGLPSQALPLARLLRPAPALWCHAGLPWREHFSLHGALLAPTNTTLHMRA